MPALLPYHSFYREVQHRAQCPKHALNSVIHFVSHGNFSKLITEDQTAQLMARLPLDYYHRVIQDFFPEAECRYGETVQAALRSCAADIADLDWLIVLVNGHYLAFVRAEGPREKDCVRDTKTSASWWVNLDSISPSSYPGSPSTAELLRLKGAAMGCDDADSTVPGSDGSGVYVFFDQTRATPLSAAGYVKGGLFGVDRNANREISETERRSVSPMHGRRRGESAERRKERRETSQRAVRKASFVAEAEPAVRKASRVAEAEPAVRRESRVAEAPRVPDVKPERGRESASLMKNERKATKETEAYLEFVQRRKSRRDSTGSRKTKNTEQTVRFRPSVEKASSGSRRASLERERATEKAVADALEQQKRLIEAMPRMLGPKVVVVGGKAQGTGMAGRVKSAAELGVMASQRFVGKEKRSMFEKLPPMRGRYMDKVTL